MFAAFGDDLIPFALNRAAMEATGETLTSLWAQWQAELRARSQAEKAALEALPGGAVEPTAITRSGYHHDSPRFLADASVVSIEGDGRSETDLYRRRPEDAYASRELYLHLESTERVEICPGSETLLFDQVDPVDGAWNSTDLWL